MRWRHALLLSVLPVVLASVLRIDAQALGEELAIQRAWRLGELPGWNPHVGLGVPLIGATATGPWYPPNALKILLPLGLAHPLLAILALGVLGAGVSIFLSQRGVTQRLALGAAVLAQLFGGGLAQLRRPEALDAALWLPWMLLAIDGVRARRPNSGLWLVGAATLASLAGDPLVAGIALAVALLCAAWRERAALVWLALGLCGGAVALVPLAESWREDAQALASLTREPGPEVLVREDATARIFTRREARDRLDAEVHTTTGGLLIFREAYYPGWKATVQGEDADVERADGRFRGVRVPAGDSLVRTKFEPFSLRLGAWITFSALALALLLAWRLAGAPSPQRLR